MGGCKCKHIRLRYIKSEWIDWGDEKRHIIDVARCGVRKSLRV